MNVTLHMISNNNAYYLQKRCPHYYGYITASAAITY
jgi:hypothetical protein